MNPVTTGGGTEESARGKDARGAVRSAIRLSHVEDIRLMSESSLMVAKLNVGMARTRRDRTRWEWKRRWAFITVTEME